MNKSAIKKLINHQHINIMGAKHPDCGYCGVFCLFQEVQFPSQLEMQSIPALITGLCECCSDKNEAVTHHGREEGGY